MPMIVISNVVLVNNWDGDVVFRMNIFCSNYFMPIKFNLISIECCSTFVDQASNDKYVNM